MSEYLPLWSALPDHLQMLLTTTLQTHTLRQWEVNEEGETCELVYRLVFGEKIEDSRSTLGHQSVTGRDLTNCIECETNAEDSVVYHDSVVELEKHIGHSSSQPVPTAAKDGHAKLKVTMPLACVADYEDYCRRTMSSRPWLYFSGGAMTGGSVQRNKDAFKKILLNPKQLVDVSHPDLSYTIRATGETVPFPIGIAPTAYHSWATHDGELATVRAACEMGVVYVSSIYATTSLEDIAEAEPQAIRWQQHRIFPDRSFTEDVVRRAEKAGVTAIVLCIDKPTDGISWNQKRGLTDYLIDSHSNFTDINISHFEPELSWDDVRWFCDLTSLPVILKGVMTPESAQMAVQVGAKGVIVSNHGGRAVDDLPATIDMLKDVVEAVGDRIEVFVDGGITTGLDVFKALAYGAQMVFIGRSALWGLAHGGQAGLCHVINILKEELLNVMQQMGTPTLKDITMERISKNNTK